MSFYTKSATGRKLAEKNNSALQEVISSFLAWEIWFYLSINDITTKFKRTTLGYSWVIIGNAIGLTAISILWSFIFNLGVGYISYVVFGFLIWGLISNFVTKSCDIFHGEFIGIIMNSPLPLMVHCLRFCSTNLFNFLLFTPFAILVIFISGKFPSFESVLLFIPGLLLVMVSGLSVSVIFGLLGARYRDFSPLISALMMPMMLVTPIMWKKELVPDYFWLFNPFTHYVDILREPLLGSYPSMLALIVTFSITSILAVIAWFSYSNYRFRLVGWL